MKVNFFGFPRSEATSDIPHVQQIDNLTLQLERARQIVGKRRVSAVLNREGHYVVGPDHEKGFHVVNAQGCCDSQQDINLLNGYCEHWLAADLFKEAQGLETEVSPKTAASASAETVGPPQPLDTLAVPTVTPALLFTGILVNSD